MKKLRILSMILAAVVMLTSVAGAIDAIDVNSKASILIDATDGHMIYGENADTKQYPASLTKLMTALIVVENISDLSEVVTAKESAFTGLSAAGSTVGVKPGEKMTVDNLLICLLVASANEAANILAERVSGSVTSFVELMNSRAEELGLQGTHFVNPSGLHDENHYTTAADVAKIAVEVRKHARLREICAMKDATIPATNLEEERYFFTTNSLISRYKELGYVYSRANGLKTGSTTPAGLCLAASAEYNGTELISVVLGAARDAEGKKGHFVESKRLLAWGFENFKRATLLSSSQPVCEVKVESAKDRDYVVAHSPESYSVLMPKDFDPEKIELIPSAETTLEAPIAKGDEIGSVVVRYEDRDYITLPLVAADDVERSLFAYIINHVGDIIRSPITMAVVAVIIIGVIIYIIYVIRYNKRKRRRRRRYY